MNKSNMYTGFMMTIEFENWLTSKANIFKLPFSWVSVEIKSLIYFDRADILQNEINSSHCQQEIIKSW